MPKTKNRNADKQGPDGTVYQARRVKTGTQAIQTHKVRCRPGTFEWRYGRSANAPQYHAGSQFAQLWERAGIAACGPSGVSDAGGGSSSAGLPDGRMRALDRVQAISRAVGGPIVRRLVDYCVEGRTPKEMVGKYNGAVTDRQLSDTLDVDLIELARAMGYAA